MAIMEQAGVITTLGGRECSVPLHKYAATIEDDSGNAIIVLGVGDRAYAIKRLNEAWAAHLEDKYGGTLGLVAMTDRGLRAVSFVLGGA